MNLVRHAGSKFPYRHPAPQGLIEKALYALGSFFRAAGTGLDEVGSLIQGPAGHVKDTGGANGWGLNAVADRHTHLESIGRVGASGVVVE